MSANERRSFTRISVDIPCTVVDAKGESMPGTIANFSEKGLFLRIKRSVLQGRPVHLNFILKPEHSVCEAHGTVAWQGPLGIGLNFSDANDAYGGFVDDLAKTVGASNDQPRKELLERLLGEPSIEIE